MRRYGLLSVMVMLSMLLALFTIPTAAQQPNPPTPQRAPQPIDQVNPPAPAAAPAQGTWHLLTHPPFDYTRFDGVFVPGPEPWGNKIYFPGGRTGGATEDPSIWIFDPVSQSWTDSGLDIIEDVSNYTANLVMDDGTGRGPAIYIIGGYNADGAPAGNIGTVQRFYPQVGIAEALPAADNWTPTVSGSLVGAMGTAVVDNIIYVFGGWENIAAPYTYNGTWAFDPSQPSGSRWTNLGITINPGRAYIQVAVQNDVIYAMGGTVYDGSSLTPLTTVEALDTNNIPAGWVARTSMPVASGEGRGFGFDADTFTEAPIPWDGHIYLAGGGAWPNSSAEAMEYLTGPDTWNQAFADLNQARRDHAGVFVPLCTPNPDDGLPGLWVFGGRMTSDNPPYADPEYYPLECAATCNVLLVDDDWDFDATVPNDGGLPYYTSTLAYLGYSYDIWDTVSQGDPTTADMEPYDTVIWFTGYAWNNGVFTPANEGQVAAYLDGGGNFLLSSQEYRYEAGSVTPFMANYLGIASFPDQDVIELDPVGNAGNPVGNGLGPYAMARPDDWAAYWPTGSYQGPYDDYVTATAGADEPFRYNASNQNNSTNYDGGPFRTVYLAWPFEWIDTVEERAEILGQALTWLCAPQVEPEMNLLPPYQSGSGAPTTAVEYTLALMNDLGFDETFNISYTSTWPINGPNTVGPVADGDYITFTIAITIPADANCLESDLATVTATAQSNSNYTDSADVETIAAAAGVGDLSGHAYDANTDLPIANAYIEVYIGDYDIDYWTWTDETGYYEFTGIEACTYNGVAEAVGYYHQGFSPTVPVAGIAEEDVHLTASAPVLAPDYVNVSLLPDTTDTYLMTLANHGTADLTWHVSEVPYDTVYPLPVESMPRGVDPQVYRDLSAAPDGIGRFIVYMRQQADLSAAFSIEDWSARGRYVLETLRNTAQRSQAALRATLDDAGVSYESRYIVNALVVEGNVNLVDTIAARPDVAFIGPNTAIPAPAPVAVMGPSPDDADAIEWNINRVDADDVWSGYGVTGEGIVVSNIDTGVQYTHAALVNQYRGNLGGSYDHNHNWWDPYNQNPSEPTDADGHGTHTMGTMVGDDGGTNQIGMAPGAQWMACDGFDNNTGYGYNAELLECAEFLIAPWDLSGNNPDPDMRPDVVNNSWGGGQAQWWYNQAVYAWRAAGIFPAFSNGNAGPNCSTTGDPGDLPIVVSSGATTSSDAIAGFSSRGPAAVSKIIKPDVSAPGVNIRSSVPGGYANYQGTSMASPHTAGEVALLWSAVPELRGDVQLTTWIIEQSAEPMTSTQTCGGVPGDAHPNNVYGWGIINAYDAVTLAESSNWDIPWLDVGPTGGAIAPGGQQAITLSFDSSGLEIGDCYMGLLKFEYNDAVVTEEFIPVRMCIGSYIYLPIITRNN